MLLNNTRHPPPKKKKKLCKRSVLMEYGNGCIQETNLYFPIYLNALSLITYVIKCKFVPFTIYSVYVSSE